jgi:hypothetical protein
MNVWNADKQRWEPSSTPDADHLRAYALEQRLRTLAVVLVVVVLGTVAIGVGRLLF